MSRELEGQAFNSSLRQLRLDSDIRFYKCESCGVKVSAREVREKIHLYRCSHGDDRQPENHS